MRRVLTNREWASVALLSIIVPVGLLVSFRLTGVFKEPPRPDSIIAEAVTWNMSRPSRIVTIDEWVENSYSDNIASLDSHVHVQEYYENMLDWPSDGDDDVVNLRVITTANVSVGFIYSVIIRLSQTGSDAFLYINQNRDATKLYGVESKVIHPSSSVSDAAYLEARGINQPKTCSASMLNYWILLDRNSLDQWATVTLEVTFFNGAMYRKVVMPILIGVLVS